MAYLTINREKLQDNYGRLEQLFSSHGMSWGVTTKLLCGNEDYLKEVLDLGIREILDSRVSNLKTVKELCPEAQTVYIKPPARRSIADIVQYADVSLNTELATIRALSEEAVKQGKLHKIIIMIEMGDLREGVLRDDVVDFYQQVFELPSIKVIGIGTNLNCLSGVMPSEDKLIQLGLYKKIIELTHHVTIPWVSAGTSVTIPLLEQGRVPEAVNHFRIGETLFFGLNLFTGETFAGMHSDVIKLHAEVIEVSEKPTTPSGDLGANPFGDTAEVDAQQPLETSHRAILDIGYLDINPDYLIVPEGELTVLDASSDMLVLDLGDNSGKLKVGDVVSFELKYMGALHLMNSPYIDKLVVAEKTEKGQKTAPKAKEVNA